MAICQCELTGGLTHQHSPSTGCPRIRYLPGQCAKGHTYNTAKYGLSCPVCAGSEALPVSGED